jgi:hypothetical protein
MAVAPQLSDAEITRLLEIAHPSEAIVDEDGTVYACRLGLALHGAREGSRRGRHPVSSARHAGAMIEYARTGAIVNTTWMF